MYVWDNNELNVLTKCMPGTMNRIKGTSCCIAEDDGFFVGGYSDGFIRAYEYANKKFSN